MKFLTKIKKYICLKVLLFSTKCIIWDYDGTLYQSIPLANELKKHFFLLAKKNNKFLTITEFDRKAVKLGSWSSAASWYSSVPEMKVLNIVDKKINKLKYIKPNPALVNFIESTQNKYLHLILTNTTSIEVKQGIKNIGFKNNVFKKIISREKTRILKPNQKLYKLVESTTKFKKHEYLCVGDSIACDIIPAKKYGFKTLPIWELLDFINQKTT